MESIARGLFVYVFLYVVLRIAGKRTIAQMTTFDLVVLLIISETTQQAMVDSDHSVTNAVVLILTLVGTAILLSLLKQRSERLEKWIESTALVLVDNGRLLKDRMDRERVDEKDFLESAREQQGLERMDQIKYVVLERNGQLTIVPKQQS